MNSSALRIVILTVLSTALNAQTMINIDLGSGTTVGGSTAAGVESSTGWQQKSGFPDFAAASLLYNNAAASGATVSGDGTGNISVIGAATTDGHYSMYNRGLGIAGTGSGNVGNSSLGTTITISGLDTANVFANGYDVYVYVGSAANTSGVNVVSTFVVGNGSTNYYLELDEALTSYQGSYVQATATTSGNSVIANYVKFSGMTGASFTINALHIDGPTDSAGALVGMQIVAIPEPSTLAMFGIVLATAALFLRRRRS